MNCLLMDIDCNFNAARANGASPARRSARTTKALSQEESFVDWPALQEGLQQQPDSRPEAVERARNLIADRDYPPPRMDQILAQQLAVQLTAEINSFPT
jgi:hypothetical protein